MRQLIAKESVRRLQKNSNLQEGDILAAIMKKFARKEGAEAAVGIIAVSATHSPTIVHEKEVEVEDKEDMCNDRETEEMMMKGVFVWGHTAPSMAIGYTKSNRKTPRVLKSLYSSFSLSFSLLFLSLFLSRSSLFVTFISGL